MFWKPKSGVPPEPGTLPPSALSTAILACKYSTKGRFGRYVCHARARRTARFLPACGAVVRKRGADPLDPVSGADAVKGIQGGGPRLASGANIAHRRQRQAGLVHDLAAEQRVLGDGAQGHRGAKLFECLR